jgi:DNA-binding NtrC family response regulator
VEQADGGTLFLDEISELLPRLQVKLLRVLQEREVQRVGGDGTIKVDVRVIAATNADLTERIRSGDFRSDLFYRLNVVSVRIPPLRERVDDILPLAHHLLRKHDGRERITGFDSVAAQILRRYQWPGNVRELENAIERATLLAKDEEITASDLPPELNAGSEVERPVLVGKSLSAAREDFERYFILECLRRHHGNVSRAAREAGLHRQNFYQKLHKYGIQRRDYMM